MEIQEISISSIEHFAVGHAENKKAATGCTVIICERGAATGVDVRGGAPGTRETDLLRPENLVQQVHAILLAGGSAFGLDAAAGVMQFLEERSIGFDVQVTRVPIVCGAALFDLVIGDHRIRPDKKMGYRACEASGNVELRQGCVGAGTGATLGKIKGMGRAMKSGFGCCALQVGALRVGALVAVNCLGDVVDPSTGCKLAGVLDENCTRLLDTEQLMAAAYHDTTSLFSGNTTIGVVVTNGNFDKAQAKKVASMAHNGYARTMYPAHSMYDGDTIFAMASGTVTADLSVAGFLGARAMERAVISAIKSSESLYGLLSYRDLFMGNGDFVRKIH